MLRNHLEKLVHFTGSVRAGSIRKYAISNHLSQPAISKCIQNLETELEVGLLIRSREGIRLTKPGEDLFEFAEELLTQADRLQTKMKSYDRLQVTGALTMGTYQSIAVYFVPSFFKFIRKEQSQLRMNLISASSLKLVEALKAGRVDFIVSIDPPVSKEFYQVPILSDTYSLYRQAGFRESLSQSLIFTLPTALDKKGKSLLSYLKDANLDQLLSSCGDFESVRAMCEQGVGYALLPDRAAKPALEAGKIELVKETKKLLQIGKHDLVFSCRKHRATDVAITWLLDQLLLMLRGST